MWDVVLGCPRKLGSMVRISGEIHPRKLTWNPKMEVWKMKILFKGVIFRFQPLVFGGEITH